MADLGEWYGSGRVRLTSQPNLRALDVPDLDVPDLDLPDLDVPEMTLTNNTHTTVTASPLSLGATVWLTGLPSAGKTTLARTLADRLRVIGHSVEMLDGDEMRRHLTADLGFSRADRDTNVRRIAYVARLLASHGVLVLVPVIAPYAATRAAVRRLHEETGIAYVEVHVATPIDVCERRDVKGLYAQARAGKLTGLTGVDDPYEPPPAPELRLDTAGRSAAESVAALHKLLLQKGLA